MCRAEIKDRSDILKGWYRRVDEFALFMERTGVVISAISASRSTEIIIVV